MDVPSFDKSVRKFTDLGDPTLLLFGGLGIFFYLWSHPTAQQVARDWAVAFGLCIALTIASKIVLHLIDDRSHAGRLRSPSGHVAIATTFYGGCVLLLTSGKGMLTRLLAGFVAALFLVALAGSRVVLGLHTLPEIAVAFLIGIFCLGLFAHTLSRGPAPGDGGQLVALLLLLAVTRFARVDGEGFIASGAKTVMDSQRTVGLGHHVLPP
jgi:hypothetical protein